MITTWVYSLSSVFIISLVSLIGVFTLSISTDKLKKIVIYMVSFSAGSLLGGAFFHILPEVVEKAGFGIDISFFILCGIGFSFLVEKVIHWNHCHLPITKHHVHPFTLMNLFGDAVHNLIDGLVIGASYLVSIPIGISTSIAVFFHEIPQEIGDFGVLLHGGFSKAKALMANFLVALTAVLGVVIALVVGSYSSKITFFLLPFAAGGFIYIASSDLIPELHKECDVGKSLLQFFYFVLGIMMMLGLLFFLE